ncbi:MAG TPA: VOC family protein [Armatimonadota bacterium]
MQVEPYLFFSGQCEEAFKFYAQCLGGKITAMHTHRETPAGPQTPPEWQDKIMHARLELGGTVLMGSDSPPEWYEAPKGFSVSLSAGSPAEADRIFGLLAENGTIKMPIQETFWAARFGMLVDRFGIPWMINCDKPE